MADTLIDKMAAAMAERWRERAAAKFEDSPEGHCLDLAYVVFNALLADTDTSVEWGNRLTWDTGEVETMPASRSLAEARVHLHNKRREEQPGWQVTAELVRRTVYTGPWEPVPTTEENP